jgi:hypothetical protein
MSVRDFYRGLIGAQGDVSLTYSLNGTEKVNYGEIDQVIDRLQLISSALALFPIKNSSTAETPMQKLLYQFTDAMTEEPANEAFDGVVKLMKLLNNGSEEAYPAEGTLKITRAGALLTQDGTDVGFPFQGATQKMPGGHTQQRIAEKIGDDLHLRLLVDGGKEVASVSVWIIGRSSGKISFSLKEARYWQVKDYGCVLLNQMIEASGKVH